MFVEIYLQPVADAANSPTSPMKSEVRAGDSRSSTGTEPSSGGNHTEVVALCDNILELQVEKEDLIFRSVGEKNLQMDTLLKFYFEKMRTTCLKSEFNRRTKLPAESRSKYETKSAICMYRRMQWLQCSSLRNVFTISRRKLG